MEIKIFTLCLSYDQKYLNVEIDCVSRLLSPLSNIYKRMKQTSKLNKKREKKNFKKSVQFFWSDILSSLYNLGTCYGENVLRVESVKLKAKWKLLIFWNYFNVS